MDFGDLEKLLGIPPGSTIDNTTGEIKPNMDNLVSGIDNKTKELSKQFDQTSKQISDGNTNNANAFTIEQLDADRKKIIEEAEMIYQISLRILKKLEKDIDDKISPDAKLYASAGPLVNSVSANLKIISDLKTKYRQEEEFKKLTSEASASDDGSLVLEWGGIQKILDASRARQGKITQEPPTDAKDAILVEGDPVDLEKEDEPDPDTDDEPSKTEKS